MKILLTGFEPFGVDDINPSGEAVKRLPAKIDDCTIETAVLPVCFETGSQKLLDLLHADSYDAVICTGLASGRTAITPEVIAINLMHARIPDNAGAQPVWEQIIPGGDDGLFSTLPVRKIVERLNAKHLPAALSLSAGTYVCNEVMYRLLAYLRENKIKIPAGFIHLPYAAEFVKQGTAVFSMPLEQITKGLEVCISEVVHFSRS